MTPVVTTEVAIPAAGTVLGGTLAIPTGAHGVVLFAHGSGSSRSSPRNARVARHLHEHGLGTLLFDLLTSEEEREDVQPRGYRFDIELLAERLAATTEWLARRPSGSRGPSAHAGRRADAADRRRSRLRRARAQ